MLKIADAQQIIRRNGEILTQCNDVFYIGLRLTVFPMAVSHLGDTEFVRDNLGDNPAKADVIALLSDMISEVTHLDDIENRLDFDAVYDKLIAEDYVAVGGFPERHDFPLAEY